MLSAKRSLDPDTRRTLLWVMLYTGFLIFGLALFALGVSMTMQLPEGLAPLARVLFPIIVVLSVVLIGLVARQLTRVLTTVRAAWRWVVLLAAVAALVALGAWSITSPAPADSFFAGIGALLLRALGLTAAVAVGVHTLVTILASRADGPHQRGARAGR